MPIRRAKALPVVRQKYLSEHRAPKEARGPRIKTRLIRAMETAGLNIADLQHWFEREYVTVYSWVHHGKEPRPSHRTDDLLARLYLLEGTIVDRVPGFPMPVTLSQRLRADHVRRMYLNACNRRLTRSVARER